MELDVSDEAGLQAKLFSVPEEIWLKIFCHIDPLDVLALARSCRFFSKFCDNYEQNIWHYQWYKLVIKHAWLSLNLPSVQSLSDLGVAFKDCCRRLWSINCVDVGGSYPKCVHCKVRNTPLFIVFHWNIETYLVSLELQLWWRLPKGALIQGCDGHRWKMDLVMYWFTFMFYSL